MTDQWPPLYLLAALSPVARPRRFARRRLNAGSIRQARAPPRSRAPPETRAGSNLADADTLETPSPHSRPPPPPPLLLLLVLALVSLAPAAATSRRFLFQHPQHASGLASARAAAADDALLALHHAHPLRSFMCAASRAL